MRISGSVAPDTHSLPTNGGARFGAPVPVSWWQGAQYSANTSRPLATRCNSAGGSGVSRGVDGQHTGARPREQLDQPDGALADRRIGAARKFDQA
jgi:hypothetical protein